MSLLLDENLSPRLIARLSNLFPGITHVSEIDLRQASDRAIWEHAKFAGNTIVTADSDFIRMLEDLGAPPKIVHLQRCNAPFRLIEDALRRNAIRIASFERSPDETLLKIAI